jgi:hypothetical protein
VPGCDNIGPGGIDIDHLTRVDTSLPGEMPEPVRTSGSRVTLGPHVTHLAGLQAAAV